MALKSILKSCAVATLLTCSMSVFAGTEQIKCPSTEFVKSIYTGSMEDVLRTDVKEFYVRGSRDAHDDNSNYAWELEILANTAQDYDFNEAYSKAQYSLNNIMKAEKEFANDQGGSLMCHYLDKNGNTSLFLSASKGSKLRK